MDSMVKEIAAVLRSTDKMAAGFPARVQERVGKPVPHVDILAVMQGMRPASLTMAKVVTKLKRKFR